jgi:hypothetical protein
MLLSDTPSPFAEHGRPTREPLNTQAAVRAHAGVRRRGSLASAPRERGAETWDREKIVCMQQRGSVRITCRSENHDRWQVGQKWNVG